MNDVIERHWKCDEAGNREFNKLITTEACDERLIDYINNALEAAYNRGKKTTIEFKEQK